MRLTKNNYYTTKNKYLTNSKIGDFLKDPHYFYQRHVTGKIEFQQTPSMKIGSAVDLYLTGSRAEFNRIYQRKVLMKEDKALYEDQKYMPDKYLLTASEWDTVHGIINAVKNTDIFKNIKRTYKSQRILQQKMQLGLFEGIAGIEDFYKITGDTCFILDFKTTKSINKEKFRYACYDYSYYRQQAMYQILFQYMFPKLNKFISHILAVENNGLYHSKIFELDQDLIEDAKVELWLTINQIKDMTEEDFKPYNLTWNDVIKL